MPTAPVCNWIRACLHDTQLNNTRGKLFIYFLFSEPLFFSLRGHGKGAVGVILTSSALKVSLHLSCYQHIFQLLPAIEAWTQDPRFLSPGSKISWPVFVDPNMTEINDRSCYIWKCSLHGADHWTLSVPASAPANSYANLQGVEQNKSPSACCSSFYWRQQAHSFAFRAGPCSVPEHLNLPDKFH